MLEAQYTDEGDLTITITLELELNKFSYSMRGKKLEYCLR